MGGVSGVGNGAGSLVVADNQDSSPQSAATTTSGQSSFDKFIAGTGGDVILATLQVLSLPIVAIGSLTGCGSGNSTEEVATPGACSPGTDAYTEVTQDCDADGANCTVVATADEEGRWSNVQTVVDDPLTEEVEAPDAPNECSKDQLQEAADILANEGTWSIPAGVYVTSGGVLIEDRDRITIQGTGATKYSTVLQSFDETDPNLSGGNIMTFDNVTNSTVQHLSFTGDGLETVGVEVRNGNASFELEDGTAVDKVLVDCDGELNSDGETADDGYYSLSFQDVNLHDNGDIAMSVTDSRVCLNNTDFEIQPGTSLYMGDGAHVDMSNSYLLGSNELGVPQYVIHGENADHFHMSTSAVLETDASDGTVYLDNVECASVTGNLFSQNANSGYTLYGVNGFCDESSLGNDANVGTSRYASNIFDEAVTGTDGVLYTEATEGGKVEDHNKLVLRPTNVDAVYDTGTGTWVGTPFTAVQTLANASGTGGAVHVSNAEYGSANADTVVAGLENANISVAHTNAEGVEIDGENNSSVAALSFAGDGEIFDAAAGTYDLSAVYPGAESSSYYGSDDSFLLNYCGNSSTDFSASTIGAFGGAYCYRLYNLQGNVLDRANERRAYMQAN